MTREELIEELSDLRDYHTVSEKTCEYLKLDLLRNDSHYSAGNDSRVAELLEYLSPTEADFSKYIDVTAFTIVANMARISMHIPAEDQMLQMLKISGYSGEEMRQYVRSGMQGKVFSIAATHLAPSVFLLSRVLADTMMDKSEWQGYKKGKKKKNYTPTPNPSRQKLENLIEYMDKNALLYLDNQDDGAYTDFVSNHSHYMCQLACIHQEFKSVSDEIERRQREFSKEAMREMERLMKKKPKRKPQSGKPSNMEDAKASPFVPLASPSISVTDLPSPQDVSAMLYPQADYFSQNQVRSLKDLRDIPPELGALLRQMEQFDDEVEILQEESWAISDQLTEESSVERAKHASEEFIPEIAMGLFQAIRNGDEIYKLKVGRIVMEDLMSMSDMPLPCGFDTDLEDEGEWDYTFIECNGKLALPVIKEGDCLSFPLNKKMETFQYAVPVSAMISRYADRPFEAPIYIRKSLIKKFKEYGCSDRKARDYAVIVATLNQVNMMEEEDFRFAGEYPEPKEQTEQEPSDTIIDARIQREIAAREDAERALRQAQKENQICRHEISSLQREIERLQNQLAEKEQTAECSETPEGTGTAAGEDISYPYHTSLRVVLYGGFEVFHRELLKLLPDVRVVETSAHIDTNPIRNADIVFLQINKTDHSGYWTVCDACKNSGVPYIHLNYASAKRCARVMVEELKKIEKRKVPLSQ